MAEMKKKPDVGQMPDESGCFPEEVQDEEIWEEESEKKAPAYYGKDYYGEMPELQRILKECNPLSREAERELLLRKEDPAAREALIFHNLRFVISVVKKYQHVSEASFWDLFQLGVEALIGAIEEYNPDYDTRLSTFAKKRIAGCVRRAIRLYRAFYLSEYMDDMLIDMAVAEKKLTAEMERMPTDNELADALNISLEELEKRKEIRKQITPVSLYSAINEEDDQTLADLLEDDSMELDEMLYLQERYRMIHCALDSLNDDNETVARQKKVIYLRYGLLHGKKLSQAKIAEQMGVSKQMVQQIEKGAKKKLADILKK